MGGVDTPRPAKLFLGGKEVKLSQGLCWKEEGAEPRLPHNSCYCSKAKLLAVVDLVRGRVRNFIISRGVLVLPLIKNCFCLQVLCAVPGMWNGPTAASSQGWRSPWSSCSISPGIEEPLEQQIPVEVSPCSPSPPQGQLFVCEQSELTALAVLWQLPRGE